MKTAFTTKTSRLIALLGWLFVYLLFVQGALPSLVLCFGSSGHIAVETPHSPISHPTSQSQDPCLDVALLMEKPEEQTLAVVVGSASQSVMPFLLHVASVPQGLMPPLCPNTLRYLDNSPTLPTPLPPVILRI